jgi:hypothetical protein
MHTSKWIRVRPLTVADFPFVRRLSAKQNGFTVPPPYVLWLLKRTNPQSCMVVEHVKSGPVAYLLSILVSEPREKVLYVWQLAASKQGMRTGAIDVALLALRTFVRRVGARKILFTVNPESPKFRAIRRYAYSLSAAGVRRGQFLPGSVSRHEREYVIKVNRSHARKT